MTLLESWKDFTLPIVGDIRPDTTLRLSSHGKAFTAGYTAGLGDDMTLLEECKSAIQTLVRLGYDKYEPLLDRIQWSIEQEKLDREEINAIFKGDEGLL